MVQQVKEGTELETGGEERGVNIGMYSGKK